jgi:hypothetical protein
VYGCVVDVTAIKSRQIRRGDMFDPEQITDAACHGKDCNDMKIKQFAFNMAHIRLP